MSARVFTPLHPMLIAEMRRTMIGRSNSDVGSHPAAIARVRRDLFGPVDHEDAQSFVDKELASIRRRQTEKWGFDFVDQQPVENSRFRWERVTPAENIPEAYALRRLSFLGQQTEAAAIRTADVSTTATASTPATPAQETTVSTTTQRTKPANNKQSQITDYLKCRKRSFSAGDISSRKVGGASLGEISSSKVGSTSGPTQRKRTKTRQ